MKVKQATALVCTGFLLSCASVPIEKDRLNVDLTFRATVEGKTIPDEKWKEAHAAGVYLIKAGDMPASAKELASNLQYTPSSKGVFAPVLPASAITEPDALVDVIAYIPFRQDVVRHSFPIHLIGQQNQETSDLMYSDNARQISPSSVTELNFSHPLSKVIVQLKAENQPDDPWLVAVDGVADRALFDLKTGKFTERQYLPESIVFKNSRSGSSRIAEAILLPESNLESAYISLRIGQKTHRLPLAQYMSELQGGWIYILTAKLTGDVLSPFQVTKRPWREVPDNTAPLWEEKDGYRLVWEEEFEGNSLNENIWNMEQVDNPQNNELQAYKKENIRVGREPLSGNSCLIVTARKESHAQRNFTSGRLNTMKKVAFRYGRIDARIRLPKTADGLWPAFWMKGNDNDLAQWPACGEIDILEMGNSSGIAAGTQDRYLGAACHWGPNTAGLRSESYKTTFSYSLQDEQFHLYTLIWDKDFISMYVDLDRFPNQMPFYRFNHRTNTQNAVTYFNKEFYVLLNLAVGGSYTGITGSGNGDQITSLNAENNQEASMYVDYIRIFQKGEGNEKLISPHQNGIVNE